MHVSKPFCTALIALAIVAIPLATIAGDPPLKAPAAKTAKTGHCYSHPTSTLMLRLSGTIKHPMPIVLVEDRVYADAHLVWSPAAKECLGGQE